MFLIGIGLLTFPSIASWITAHHQAKLVDSYRHSVSYLDSTRYEAMISAADQFNRDLAACDQRWSLPQPLYDQYNSLLSLPPPVNDKAIAGVIGYISISKIKVKLPLYHGTDQKALDLAVCHVAGSSLPSDQPNTHTVITGHRSRVSSRLFRDLDELEIGDEFSIIVLNKRYEYEVDQIQVVLPSDLSKLEIEDGKNYCTLVTCTPYGSESHRLLVRGHLLPNSSTTYTPASYTAEPSTPEPYTTEPSTQDIAAPDPSTSESTIPDEATESMDEMVEPEESVADEIVEPVEDADMVVFEDTVEIVDT